MDVSQYLEIFLDESREHIQNLNTQIMDLEQNPESENTINEIFRAAHSLKGMAGTMGYKRMQTLTHDMENVFSEVRNGNIKVKANMIDILFQCLDALEEYVDNIQNTADEGTNDNAPLIKMLNDILNEGKGAAAAPAAAEAPRETPAAPTAGSGALEEKWHEIKLDSSQLTVLKEALAQGKKVYGLTVKVQETCILKAARAFLVFKAIEELGEIMVSCPPVQDIEDEKFDFDFSLICITECSLDKLLAAVRNVSEIESAKGAAWDPNTVVTVEEEPEEPKKEETKT